MNKTALDLSNWLGYLTNDEVELLQKIARLIEQESPVIVNIGAGAGTSGLAFREACPDADLYTVDINSGGPKGGLKGERNAFKLAKAKLPTQILGDSKDVGKEWSGPPIDLLFIDGDHSEAGIRGDLDAWLGHVKDGGYVLIHDYDSDNWPAVKRVTDEYFESDQVVDSVCKETVGCTMAYLKRE